LTPDNGAERREAEYGNGIRGDTSSTLLAFIALMSPGPSKLQTAIVMIPAAPPKYPP
jgi:hypothetical protein